ncbi:MAG: prepilin-type N-terminal cleavage/methylation domain-containing protein [bacterium]
MKILQNNKGFTLIELIIAMIIISIITAGSIYIYDGFISSAQVSSTVSNIEKLSKACVTYSSDNGGSFNGLTAAALQQDSLLPDSWLLPVSGGENVNPLNNKGIVADYWIGEPNDWPLNINANYIIGIMSLSMTDRQALQMCDALENQISYIIWQDTAYSLPGSACATVIPDNNTLISDSSGATILFGF